MTSEQQLVQWRNFNNVVRPQSLIVLILFLPIKQCCDITKLDCTHSISSHSTMLWHHKVWLYSFNFFPSNNVVTSQSLIVLIVFLPIQQCCYTTMFDCTHSILPIKQFCDITKLSYTHCISSHSTMSLHYNIWLFPFNSSHQTMLWHHKSWLYSFYFFPFNYVVTPQSLIVLV